MDDLCKKSLSEHYIRTKFISPAVKQAGWDEMSLVRKEIGFTKGRLIVLGKLGTRGNAKFADYALDYKSNILVSLIEAKDNNHTVGDGMQQALDLAATLDIPFVFSSNDDAFHVSGPHRTRQDNQIRALHGERNHQGNGSVCSLPSHSKLTT